VKRAAVLAFLDDPVIGAGGDQQRDHGDHQKKRQRVELARIRRQRFEAVLENAAQLKTEQDLPAKDQHARLVEPDLDLV
jgi:hypothetical protein